MAPRPTTAGRLAIVSGMRTRPTAKWRERFQEEHARLAAGTLRAGDAYAIHLWRIETGEREELCEYISLVLEEAGIDTRELAARRGIGVHELTYEWREW